MPNHVTNELTASSHVLDSLANGDRLFDFNKIVPMPEIIPTVSVASHVEDWARIATGHLTIDWIIRPSADPLAAFREGNYGAAANTLHRSKSRDCSRKAHFRKISASATSITSSQLYDPCAKPDLLLGTIGISSTGGRNGTRTKRSA